MVPAGTGNVPPFTGSKPSTGVPFTVASTVFRSSFEGVCFSSSNVHVTLREPSGEVKVHVRVPFSWATCQSEGMPEMLTVEPWGTSHVPDCVGSKLSTGIPSTVAVTPFRSSVDGAGCSCSNVHVTLTELSGAVIAHTRVPSSCVVTQSEGIPSRLTAAPWGIVHVPVCVGSKPSTGSPSAVAVTPFSSSTV